ncbi:MAG: CBS domain-containing protein [Deltaproteobacteria bacterium]|nr:CBS domain-containing protein [Kofleriaceae bacterium]
MSQFTQPVADYMTREVEWVRPDTELPFVVRLLERFNISAVPVVDGTELVGVLSRTDLLHAGLRHASASRRARSLVVPPHRVNGLMKRSPLTVAPHTPLATAARAMQRARIHRVFVVEHGAGLVGVLSTADLAAAVRDARVETPLSVVMSSPILTVKTTDPLSLADQRLEHAHVSGLVVIEDDWPVGLFSQVEAMASRDLPRDTPVEDVFEQALICLPDTTKIHRAAAYAARLDVRRVVACRQREAVGIVSGLDFARVVAGP